MPTKKLKIHFIGIGGIGVSALAKYYLKKGHRITGSDLVSSEITEAIKKLGAKIFIGGNKVLKNADLIIYSPAVKIKNLKLKIPALSYPEALGELTKQHFTIAISGTHGKSTTTAMIGLLLAKAGLDPTVIVGTKLKEFNNSNCRVGKSKYLVIEADEHFASFLNYWPKIIVLTALEPDHLDYYKSFKNYVSAFQKFISHLPQDGILIANRDDKNIRKAIFNSQFSIYNKFSILNFQLNSKGALKIRKILKVPGEYNISNALAALTVARALKIPDKISFKALSEYKGSWRRFEEIKTDLRGLEHGLTRKITIISDYGHHPTEIRVTLKATREKYPEKKIWCIYQPHQYQRTYYLFKDFVKVLRQAQDKFFTDKLIITDIYDVAGREEKKIKERINSEKLVKAINKKNVIYLPKAGILNYLKRNLQGGEVVIIMGAGDIYNLTLRLTEKKKRKKIK